MTYVVKLEQFEGPLDLLLYLIQREEMDIYDIPIARITEQYLAIERVRFQNRLKATVEASTAARRGRVPQLILQPLVENAVRHGIAPLESGGFVKVTATVEADTLAVV